MDRRVHAVLAEVEGRAFWAAVVLLFISFHLTNYLLLVLLLWCMSAGILVAYSFFRVLPRVPNLVLHKPRPPKGPRRQHQTPTAIPCPVCDEASCSRHQESRPREYLHPWDDIMVPRTVDAALTDFMENVFKNFIYSWHRKLDSSAEGFEDDLRSNIRFAVASLLRRAQKIDIPHVISHKLLQAIAAHIYMCNNARRKLRHTASITEIEAAVMKEYGSHWHCAMRGPTGKSRYFRQLIKALMPLLLPEPALQSRMMSGFIQELFTMKIFIPAMNFVAKPDFLNKLLLIVFDKNSRLQPMYGPESKAVKLLARFSSRRSHTFHRQPLTIPLKQLLNDQGHLYKFMGFLKRRNALHVLQVYLTLDDLKARVNNCTRQNAPKVLSEVESLYNSHLLPSSQAYLPLDNSLISDMSSILETEDPAIEKCYQLREIGVFNKIRGHIYTELLMKIFYPEFSQDHQFYDCYISKQKAAGAGVRVGRTGDKWRQKTTLISMKARLKPEQALEVDPDETGRDSPLALPQQASSMSVVRIKVVDAEVINNGIADGYRPYTLYYLLTTRKIDGVGKNYLVKRRFKEFIGLDSKLRQFHGNIAPSLPSKRAFKNLDKAFIDSRMKELEQYLQELLEAPGVREGKVLASFLDEASDPSLFIPDSVGDKAVKNIKSIVKNERSTYTDEFLQNLVQFVDSPQTPQTSGDTSMALETNRIESERYIQQQCEDVADRETIQIKPWLQAPKLKDSLKIDSVMDLVVFVAASVYQVTPNQLTALKLTQLLGQESLDSLIYNFVAGRVELLTNEQKIVQLINLLNKSLFGAKDPPRTEDDHRRRFDEAIERLFGYPPSLVLKIIGEERYKDGTSRIIEGLQCRELNKQLFFQLLDIIILELFPELQQ